MAGQRRRQTSRESQQDDDVDMSGSAAGSDVEGREESDRFSEEDEEAGGALPDEMRDISFGALAEAQDSLQSQETQHTNHDRIQPSSNSEKVAALKARLVELKGLKNLRKASDGSSPPENRTWSRQEREQRSSKHAPMEQSSKYQVPRARPAVEVLNNPYHSRDPRFSSIATGGARLDENKLQSNYAFLSKYRDNEVQQLKASLTALKAKAKKRKSRQLLPDEEEEAEMLKRNVNRLENKKKSEEGKAREADIVRRHKRDERERVKQGKQPFYLKQGEAKRMADKEHFEGLKGKERRKLTERREKRKNRREKRAVEGGAMEVG